MGVFYAIATPHHGTLGETDLWFFGLIFLSLSDTIALTPLPLPFSLPIVSGHVSRGDLLTRCFEYSWSGFNSHNLTVGLIHPMARLTLEQDSHSIPRPTDRHPSPLTLTTGYAMVVGLRSWCALC